MKFSNNGLAKLEISEGLKLTAYLCLAKVWTIGLGTTVYPNGSPVKQGDVITKEQAYVYALHHLEKFAQQVNRLVKVPLTQNQFDALVLLTYNIGAGALQKSTLLKKLNAEDYEGAAKEFKKWNKVTDKKTGKKRTVAGLTTRRKQEAELFLDNYAGKSITGAELPIIQSYKPDPNNEPIPYQTLPLPTAHQEYGEPVPPSSMNQKLTMIGVGGAGASGIATVITDPQIITPAFSFLQYADYRVALVVVGVVGLGGLIWWIWKGRR
jgi:lysozyme